MAPVGMFKAQKISEADKSRAVKRAVASATTKVRITAGQRRTILATRKG